MAKVSAAQAEVAALLERVTAELGEVKSASAGLDTEFSRNGRTFAVLRGTQVALRLRPDIAEAALRTPDTEASQRGAEWIEFVPDPSEPQDVDRLSAWLTIGWRAAQRTN